MQIDFNAPVTIADVKATAVAFLRWWKSEILACLPARWQELYRTFIQPPLLHVGLGTWRLEGIDARDYVVAIDPNAPAYETRELLLRAAGSAFAHGIEAELPRDDVLLRRITLPAAAVTRLRSVVRLQLDRLSPIRGDDVYFDYRMIGTTEQNEIDVEVAITAKSIVGGYERALRELGLVPRVFRISGSPLKFAPSGLRWTRTQQLQALLAIGCVLVWAAAFWLAPIMRDSEITELRAQIASVRPAALAADAERRELGKYSLPFAAISADRQRAVDVLLALTKTLPTTVHVTEFTMDDGVVHLRGTAPPSLRVGAELAKTKLFARVEYPKTSWAQDFNHFELEGILCPTGPNTHDH